jgi:hypothetical protein
MISSAAVADRQQDDEEAELLRGQRLTVDIGIDQSGDDVVGRFRLAGLRHLPGVAEDLHR